MTAKGQARYPLTLAAAVGFLLGMLVAPVLRPVLAESQEFSEDGGASPDAQGISGGVICHHFPEVAEPRLVNPAAAVLHISGGGAGIPAVGPSLVPRATARFIRWVWVQTTGYCGTCLICTDGDGLTSTMVRVADRPHGIAVAPKAIPYGTMIRVDGYRPSSSGQEWFPCDDTGSRMRSDWQDKGIIHMDLRFIHHANARAWGTRWMWVEVRP